jgi:hypothetical protein
MSHSHSPGLDAGYRRLLSIYVRDLGLVPDAPSMAPVTLPDEADSLMADLLEQAATILGREIEE